MGALTPFGVGTPRPTSSAPPSGAAGTRYINPATRDYEIDTATGQQAQMPNMRQRVLLALITLQTSMSVDPSRGIKPPTKMRQTTFVTEMRQAVRSALAYMTDAERSIVVDSIDVLPGIGGRAQVTVAFTDLTTGEQDAATARI